MEANATLECGPLQVELKAENADKLESELDQMITFLESNNERISSIFGSTESPTVEKTEDNSVSSDDEDEAQSEPEDGPLENISNSLRLNEDLLDHAIITDDNYPKLYLEDVNLLGDNKTERQRKASLILLYLWDECYGTERVKTSSLKSALSMSGISESNLANMYQGQGDRFFDRSGRGASATIGLTTPGKRRAQKALSELVERLESDSSESDNAQGSAIDW